MLRWLPLLLLLPSCPAFTQTSESQAPAQQPPVYRTNRHPLTAEEKREQRLQEQLSRAGFFLCSDKDAQKCRGAQPGTSVKVLVDSAKLREFQEQARNGSLKQEDIEKYLRESGHAVHFAKKVLGLAESPVAEKLEAIGIVDHAAVLIYMTHEAWEQSKSAASDSSETNAKHAWRSSAPPPDARK